MRVLEAKLAAMTASSPVIQSTEIRAMPRFEPAIGGSADQGTLPGGTMPVSRRRSSSVTACARSATVDHAGREQHEQLGPGVGRCFWC